MTKMLSCCPFKTIKSLAFLASPGKTNLSVLSLKLGYGKRLFPIITFAVFISAGRFFFHLLL